ncbi:MAG: hypothetical protein WCP35_11650 [Verrucomicrobiota bacterium]
MSKEWDCVCKDCNKPFAYSDTKYQSGRVRGWSRPERCDSCRAQHAREINSIGQPYYKVLTLRPILDPKLLTSDLGRFDREDRPHVAVEVPPAPLDEKKFGIKDNRLIEMFDFFIQDPGLQVVVVVGPTGSGKSTYLPYRLVELPENYKDADGNVRDRYWTVPIETEKDLEDAKREVNHTPLAIGLRRFYTDRPPDSRAEEHVLEAMDQQMEAMDRKMFHRYGQIVVTQPRIQATRNIPDYIAKSMISCRLGAGFDVGFRHSGSPNSDWSTKLAFVTDGTLISWIAKGELDKINTVMIDEAHERSLNIDIIIGLLTQMLPRYPRLKLIIASATISADKFINHFKDHLPERKDENGNVLPNCRLMEFEGKSFKVSPHFHRDNEPPLDYHREELPKDSEKEFPLDSEREKPWEGGYGTPEEIHKQVASKAMEILKAMYDDFTKEGGYLIDHAGQKIDITERQGDILCFLHGEKPIQNCCKEVEESAKEKLPNHVELRALPLYTTLTQKQQDEALKERKQPHDVLFERIVKLLDEIVKKNEPGDILAILNNAGQIHNLCASLESRFNTALITDDNKSLFAPKETVSFHPWFTHETAKQLYGEKESKIPTLPQHNSGRIRVVISTSRHSKELNRCEFQHWLEEEKPAERRVIVSTNVAETSLTIHGILHVVDSGLIYQKKWDRTTQTSSVTAILQSRAGCKQRWGRAGRLQAGDAWLLYTEKQFGKDEGEADDKPEERCFVPYSLPEISRSPLEEVLLTAKKAGVASLDPEQFPWLDVPDSAELERAAHSLEMKGALDPDGDLTEHGLELSNMRQDPRIGNMLVIADRFACAFEMTTVVAVATQKQGLESLLIDPNWNNPTRSKVRQPHTTVMSGCSDDLDASLKLMACWDEVSSAGSAFIQLVRLFTDDGFSKQLRDAASANKGPDPGKLLETVRNSLVEAEVNAAANELLGSICDRDDRRKLKDAIGHSLSARKNFQRLGLLWQSVVRNWALPKVWEEGDLHPILIERLTDYPENDEVSKKVEAILRDVETIADPALLADRIGHFKGVVREAIDEALLRLPGAAAKAWAHANYLIPDAFAKVVAARKELLKPLEAHKKGEETRLLDLSRNERLRVLFAHCLPDNCYQNSGAGVYCPITPTTEANPAERVLVQIRADFSLYGAKPPHMFVCVERRAARIVAGKDRRMLASFVVSLPKSWDRVIGAGQLRLHQLGTIALSKFIRENCHSNPAGGTNLMLDQIFPRGAHCRVTITERIEEGLWRVAVSPPHKFPDRIKLSFKKASEENCFRPESEEEIRTSSSTPTDLEFTTAQCEIGKKAGVAIEESTGAIDASQWEDLYQVCDDVMPDEYAAIRASSELVASESAHSLQSRFDSAEGVLSSSSMELSPGGVVDVEVDQIIITSEGRTVPSPIHPFAGEQCEGFTEADIGLAKEKILVFCRQLTPNPYAGFRPGQKVTCTVTKKGPKGAELNIDDGLCGWIYNDKYMALPQENLGPLGEHSFDAIIEKIDFEREGKIFVSRRPIVRSLIQSIEPLPPLIGKVTVIKQDGAEIELAPGLLALLPSKEVSWQHGGAFKEILKVDNTITVVLLRKEENDDSRLRVSMKRVNSGEYIVSGKPWLFFAGQPKNLKTILEHIRDSEMAAVNVVTISKDKFETRILIGADDKDTFRALVRELRSMACENHCSLTPMGKGHKPKPEPLENLPLPGQKEPIPSDPPRTEPETSHVIAPPLPSKGLTKDEPERKRKTIFAVKTLTQSSPNVAVGTQLPTASPRSQHSSTQSSPQPPSRGRYALMIIMVAAIVILFVVFFTTPEWGRKDKEQVVDSVSLPKHDMDTSLPMHASDTNEKIKDVVLLAKYNWDTSGYLHGKHNEKAGLHYWLEDEMKDHPKYRKTLEDLAEAIHSQADGFDTKIYEYSRRGADLWIAGAYDCLGTLKGEKSASRGFICHSEDNGKSWERQWFSARGHPEPVYGIYFSNSHEGWALTLTGILHTTNRGASWKRILQCDDPNASPFDPGYLFIRANDVLIVSEMRVRSSLFYSKDRGLTWSRIPVNPESKEKWTRIIDNLKSSLGGSAVHYGGIYSIEGSDKE